MPKFSKLSKERLVTVKPALRQLAYEVIKFYDFTVLCGFRSQEEQEAAYTEGRSRVTWPFSKHNIYPSDATDWAPYPVEWPKTEFEYRHWYLFIGFVRGVAAEMGIRIRCGADWDGDFRVKDQNFHDLPHIELL